MLWDKGRPFYFPFLFTFFRMWEWRCRPYNFIKTTYDISLNSHISLLPYGFSPQWPVEWPMWCPLDKENPVSSRCSPTKDQAKELWMPGLENTIQESMLSLVFSLPDSRWIWLVGMWFTDERSANDRSITCWIHRLMVAYLWISIPWMTHSWFLLQERVNSHPTVMGQELMSWSSLLQFLNDFLFYCGAFSRCYDWSIDYWMTNRIGVNSPNLKGLRTTAYRIRTRC